MGKVTVKVGVQAYSIFDKNGQYHVNPIEMKLTLRPGDTVIIENSPKRRSAAKVESGKIPGHVLLIKIIQKNKGQRV